MFGLKFCKIKQNIRKEKFKTSQDGSFKEPCGSFKSQKVEVSRVCVQRNFSPCANKQRSQQVETKRVPTLSDPKNDHCKLLMESWCVVYWVPSPRKIKGHAFASRPGMSNTGCPRNRESSSGHCSQMLVPVFVFRVLLFASCFASVIGFYHSSACFRPR